MKLAAAILLLPILSFANTKTCETELKNNSSVFFSMGEGARLKDGRFQLSIDYTRQTKSVRTIELPSTINTYKTKKDLRVLVLAGNSGSKYEKTRHNLAFIFGDYLLAKYNFLAHESADQTEDKPETLNITYDDGSVVPWTHQFASEKNTYRTDSGEFFFIPNLNSKPTIVIRPIGDYNEIGDFAVPLMERLNLEAHQIVLVHDDLRLQEGQFGFEQTAPQKADGNNAIFSMNRALSYAAINEIIDELSEEFQSVLHSSGLENFKSQLLERAAIRQNKHLTQDRALDIAFKNSEALVNATRDLQKFLVNAKTADLKQTIIFEQQNLSRIRKDLPEIMKDLGRKDITATEKELLTQKREQILEKAKPLTQEIKKLEADIAAVEKAVAAKVKSIAESHMSYRRVRIGTDDGVPKTGLADFVLGTPPAAIFTEKKWAELEAQLADFLK